MSKLQLRSHVRRSRTIQVDPELDRWVEETATLWGVSYSEACNRIVREQRELRRELGAALEVHNTNGTSQLIHVLLERFKEELCRGMDRIRDEVEKVKSNLYLLETMSDRAMALQGAHRHDAWRREVTAAMRQRKGGQP